MQMEIQFKYYDRNGNHIVHVQLCIYMCFIHTCLGVKNMCKKTCCSTILTCIITHVETFYLYYR